jgi:TrmH family RNA methyltransferase
MTAPAEPITSVRNPLVADAARLGRARDRRRLGRTLLEGPGLVAEAVAAGIVPETVFVLSDDGAGAELAAASRGRVLMVSEQVLARVSTTQHPQSPVAVIAIPPSSARPGRRALVAWQLGDPGNCGTLIRTAAAFGYDYLAGPGSADTWSPKVLRAAAGSHFRAGIGDADTLDDVASGRTLVATVVAGGDPPGPLPPDAAILIGSEPQGLPPEVVAACATAVTVPMLGGVESLNAAVAGAIVAFLGAWDPGANLTSP